MKRLPLCFFLIAALFPLVFADGGAFAVSRLTPGDNTSSTENNSSASRRGATTVSRTGQNQSRNTSDDASDNVVSRVATTRGVVTRGDGTTGRTAVSRGDGNGRVLDLNDTPRETSVPRGTINTIGTGTVSRTATTNQVVNQSRTGAGATVSRGGSANNVNKNSDARRTTNVVQRAPTPAVAAQNAVREQNRTVGARAATTTPTTESIAEATQRLELTTDLNASCQQQYNDCMDQFCNVIDSNQGRCSCSANLSDYTSVEEAVTDANNQLNDVAQRIRYVGLSADEIRAIMEETEAEEALSGARDTSETRSMLDEIEDLIRDPTSTSSYSSTSTSFGLDMNLDFSSNSADIFNLDFLNTGTSSFSNLRGTDLYNSARNRCKSVLNQCEEAGANIDQITANYDLAIDKDCISYEQGLTKMNETLVSNVRSANLMLQKARLAVMKNQNQYDAKACIAALDTCMTDEMVCGANYTKCLDPTKRYIDENGEVVLGENITNITDFMQNYNNADINSEFLQTAYGKDTQLTTDYCKKSGTVTDGEMAGGGNDGRCIAKYLLQKIGTQEDATAEGLCRPVLDKCQAYTYKDKTYSPYNDIVVNYVQRAMVNIKAQQQQIISDYSSNCILDVANCYNQQVTQVNSWTSSASVSSIYNVMRGACRNVALTCAYAVFDGDNKSCPVDGTTVDGTTDANNTCIQSISEMFYQSLLCPDNSIYDTTTDTNRTEKRRVNDMCVCIEGYEAVGTYCYKLCGDNQTRNPNNNTCVCKTGFTMKDGICVSNESETTGSDDSGTTESDNSETTNEQTE